MGIDHTDGNFAPDPDLASETARIVTSADPSDTSDADDDDPGVEDSVATTHRDSVAGPAAVLRDSTALPRAPEPDR